MTLWTRAIAAHDPAPPHDVAWSMTVAGSDELAASGTSTARADDDHTVHVTVTGLRPGTRYRYRFEAGGEVVEGRTRTLPDAADHLRFAVVCCARFGYPGLERYGEVVDEDPAFVLHLGDYVYETGGVGPTGEMPDPPWECRSLDDYRRRYRLHRRHPALRRLHAEVPMIATWDDHEVADNAPDDEGADRRAAGQRAWAEWMPMRLSDRPAPIDRHLTVDGLLDLALVDARFSGRSPTETDGPQLSGDHGELLGRAQWQQLEAFVRSARSPWFVFANQVQVGPMTLGFAPHLRLPPWRRIVNPDQWDGFVSARHRLYRDLSSLAGRAVVLSGDLHSSWSRSLRDDGEPIAHEFTAPSISGESYADAFRSRTRLPSRVLAATLRLLNRGVGHLDLERHGYLVCDVTPDEFVATFVLGDRRRRVAVRLPAQ